LWGELGVNDINNISGGMYNHDYNVMEQLLLLTRRISMDNKI
jgi:hypothetical protein